MAGRKLIVICQSGGKFHPTSDGSLIYFGGNAHAMSVSNETKFDDFRSDLAEIWKCELESMTINYFLPTNKHTLITISSDKDFQHMIEFHEHSATVDVYVNAVHDASASDATTALCSRSSRTTAAEPVSPVHSPTAFVADAEDTMQHKLPASWKNIIIGLDQQFNSVNEFRDALYKYSLAHGFRYTYITNESRRVSVKCKAEGCPWFIIASKLSTTQLFRIRKINGTHSCDVGANSVHRPHAAQKLVVSIVKEKLQNSPHYRPAKLIEEIQQEFGIKLDYMQAWRSMATAWEELHGSHKESYNQLPSLCEKIMETNPGSVATIMTREDLSFHRLFVAFHASVHGFLRGCRPLLFLNDVILNSKFRGELLTATTLDANGGVFPVAFAIVDELSNDNWHWFMVELESVLQTSLPLTIVADKKKRTSEAQIFKDCYHSYCLHYLTGNLKDELKGDYTQEVVHMIVTEFYNAAYAPTIEGFEKCMENLKHVSAEAYEWAQQSNPWQWANALFGGARYNHVESNIADSFYGWASELPALPMVQVIETMCRKIMELFHTRRLDSDEWSSRLIPSLEDKLQKNTLDSRSVEVLFSPNSTYEVRDSFGVVYVVNIYCWNCNCGEWEITGVPCLHAMAVIERLGENVYDYCSAYFLVETFKLSYSESINPVLTLDRPIDRGSSPVLVHPPARRPIGRPRKERVQSPKRAAKRPLRCSKCKTIGHNKISCKQAS